MKQLILLFLSFGYSTIINIPGDYPTIQEGIDVAEPYDTVLVAPGLYQENLIIDETVTLASYALFDDLTEWYEWDATSNQYELTNYNIANTIIDGSQATQGEVFQSTILIDGIDALFLDCIEPVIFGLTITGGKGTQIIDNDDVVRLIGGGILSNNAIPSIHYNYIKENHVQSLYSGGGVNLGSGIDFNERDGERDLLRCEGEVNLSDNFYRGNESLFGQTLSTTDFEGSLDMSNSVFDVYAFEQEDVSEYWIKLEEDVEYTVYNGDGDLDVITHDVWVNSEIGVDSPSYSGTASDPFLTINYALSRIYPSYDTPVTINVAGGTYSPSTTGEFFPIVMFSNVSLIGQGEDLTILDAEGSSTVIVVTQCANLSIKHLAITGGNALDGKGGGLYIYSSNPNIHNITISQNQAILGGGIYSQISGPLLSNLKIESNVSSNGGGLYFDNSIPRLISNSIIRQNVGGAVYIKNSYDVKFKNLSITDNYEGNGIYLYNSFVSIDHTTISRNDLVLLENLSNVKIKNSIIWDNISNEIEVSDNSELLITYSNIDGGFEGEGNINSDPLFNDPSNGDFSLQNGSPCIDMGDPNIWYDDLDGSNSDMGAIGGLFIDPNFISHDFGDVGEQGSYVEFELFNYRSNSIIIDSVNFNTTSFTTNTPFPLIIDPLEFGVINIEANDSSLGHITDSMELFSNQLPDGISVLLALNAVSGIALSGNLSGTYDSAIYRITGNLTIAEGDTVILQPGTQFLFDGWYDFFINEGTLKAIGTATDSIIFDNIGSTSPKWNGFTLHGVTDETIFEYVRISGAEKTDDGNEAGSEVGSGAGMLLILSDPIINHVAITKNHTSSNFYGNGGGIYMWDSSPTLSNVVISENYASNYGGGMDIYLNSYPTLNNITIRNNISDYAGGGLVIWTPNSNLEFNYITIQDNIAQFAGGVYIRDPNYSDGNFKIYNMSIINNIATIAGGGIYSNGFNYLDHTDLIVHNTTIVGNLSLAPIIYGYNGGDINYSGAGIYISHIDLIITNSILEGNFSPGELGVISNPIDWYVDTLDDDLVENTSSAILNNNNIDHWLEKFTTHVTCSNNLDDELNENCSLLLTNHECEEAISMGLCTEFEHSNINADPLFLEPPLCFNSNDDEYCGTILNMSECVEAIDLELCTQFKYGNVRLQENSPCIDSGTTDLDGNGIEDITNYYGSAPDMGSYEFGIMASDNTIKLPKSYQLYPGYPNPFNPITTIGYQLPKNGIVLLNVYNIQGRQIETIEKAFKAPGYHTIKWNASPYPSGIYLIRMESGSFNQTQKVVLVK